jgi:predicted phosphoribosyltransferase
VADALGAPLEVMLVRKLGVPGHEELAMGAIASGGVLVVNEHVVASLDLGEEAVARVAAAEWRELERREALYRGGRPPVPLAGRRVVLVDDGLATGATMRAAARAVRTAGAAGIVVGVPVAAEEACAGLRREADAVVCVLTPSPLLAIGEWYDDFAPVGDDAVREALAAPPAGSAGGAD